MQATVPSPPPPPPLPGISRTGAADLYRAVREQRSELQDQLETLEEKRQELSRELQAEEAPAEAKAGIVERIKGIDARIIAVEGQIAEANSAVAQAAAVPGAVVEPPPMPRNGPPEEVWMISTVFILAVLMPISIAWARRLWKRGSTIVAPVPREVQERLDGLSNAVESIGLEVERIGEGQRFITRLFSEQRAPARLPDARLPDARSPEQA